MTDQHYDEYEREKARRLARGEPLRNEEVLQILESSKQHIKARAASGESSEGMVLAKDLERTLEQGKEFLLTKNKNEELQNIQNALHRMSLSDDVEFQKLKAKYEDVMDLSSRLMSSNVVRKIVRRLNKLMLQALSSEMEKEEHPVLEVDTEAERSPEEAEREHVTRDTEHTRKNYTLFIRGRKFGFLTEDLTPEAKLKLADEAHGLFLDIALDKNARTSVSVLIRFLREISKRPVSMNEENARYAKEVSENLKSLLQNMVEDYSLNDLTDSWSDLQNKTDENPELTREWADFLNFVEDSTSSRKAVDKSEWKEEFLSRVDRIRKDLLKIRPELFRFIQEIDIFLMALKDDQFLKETSGVLNKLSQDLFFNEAGDFKFKPEALNQIRELILPELQEHFKYIALPMIDESDDTIEYQISDAVLKTGGLMPDMLWIGNSNHLKITGKTSRYRSSLHLVIDGVKFDVKDVHIKYQRLSFPKISDEGKLNARVVGRGLRLEAWLSSDAEDDRMFRVDEADVNISGLQLYDMDFEKHELLYSIFKPFIEYSLRRRAEETLEKKLKESMFDLSKLTDNR